jgi:hypothetical protein
MSVADVLRCSVRLCVIALCVSPATAQKSAPALQPVDRDRLCVTNGAVSALGGGRLSVTTPSSRAIVQSGTDNAADQTAELRFQYLGPSADDKPLASGELRRQIGLKLRAQDTCNLVYAMWHIAPDARIAVSIKRNVGMSTHQQCGAHGYINLSAQGVPPPIRPGEAHVLRAELHGNDLTVVADGKAAWQGSLGDTPLPIGPPGFRTDNAQFAFGYFVAAPTASRAAPRTPPARGACVQSEGD